LARSGALGDRREGTAEAAGFDDAIMFDREGWLAEASAANVFAILGGSLVTPPLNPDVFPGITRQTVLDLARAEGIEVAEWNIERASLSKIDGAFLTSTLMEIRGISHLDDRALQTTELPVFKAVVSAFRRATHG
jgi:branched-chain amino acid aminotransferase